MKINITSALLFFCAFCINQFAYAQGTWTPLANTAPAQNYGAMLLLPDGTVIVRNSSGGGYGNGWNKLTPDSHGSYINGTWSTITPMNYTRYYFSSQVLQNGLLYVAGGEYGTGHGNAEIYDPQTDIWTNLPALPPGSDIEDGNSELLPDGRVLQGTTMTTKNNFIFDPVTNTFSVADPCIGLQRESAWVKLKDNSILLVNWISYASERYIPSTGHWVSDATVPVYLYESLASDTGPGALLPDGRVLYLGGSGATALYTPSGTSSPGTWVAGPNIPNGLGVPDAPAAMLSNGNVFFTAGPITTIGALPTYFFEFDTHADTFIKVLSPLGYDSMYAPCFATNMLVLPDGNILFSNQGTFQYYVYTPSGTPMTGATPILDTVMQLDCLNYKFTGKLFNGISVGASFGDDVQNSTNFPLVRLTAGTNVYYARTHDWNRTGVQTGMLPDTAQFTLPAGLPDGFYSLEVVVNGFASTPVLFKTCAVLDSKEVLAEQTNDLSIYPNPANTQAKVVFHTTKSGNYTLSMIDILGRKVRSTNIAATAGENSYTYQLNGIAKGVYTILLSEGSNTTKSTLVVE